MRNPHNIVKRKSKIGIPSPNEGLDGDISLNITNNGIALFGKIRNKWYKFGNAQDVNKYGDIDTNKKLLKHKLSVSDINVDKTINIGKTAITTDPNRVFTIGNTDIDYLNISSKTFDVITDSTKSQIDLGYIVLQGSWDNNSSYTSWAGIQSVDGAGNHLQLKAGDRPGNTAGNLYLSIGTGSTNGNVIIGKELSPTDGSVVAATTPLFEVNATSTTLSGTLALTSTTADQLKVLYDGSNYGLINVASDGHVEIESVGTDADMTLNVAGDLELNADGGTVTIKDNTVTHFVFDCDNTSFKIHDDANEFDIFQIAIGAEGDTIISTLDADTTVGHLTFDVDGEIRLDAADTGVGDGIQFLSAGTKFGEFTAHHTYSEMRLYENEGASTDDFFSIQCYEHGGTKIQTLDNAATAAHLEIEADGDIKLDAKGTDIEFQVDGTTFGLLDGGTTAAKSRLFLYEAGGASTDDYLLIQSLENGASEIKTIDDAGVAANFLLDIDGDITLDAHGKQINFAFNGTNLVLFDMNAEELRIMNSANQNDYFNIVVGTEGATTISTVDADTSAAHLTLDPDGDLIISGADTKINAAKKLYFDGGTHTYIEEQSADLLNFRVGGTDLFAIAEDATTSAAQSSKLYTGCPIYLKDIGGVSDTPGSGFGSLYVNSDVLYFKTDGGTVTNLLSGGSSATKHWMDWYYYSANLATQNVFYSEKHNDEWGVSSNINTDLSSSGYSTTTLNNAWRMIRYSRRVPYTGTVTKFMVHLESTGAAADSDIEVALWWADALADDTAHTTTDNLTCDHLCTLTFDFSSTSRWMTKQTTSFNATAISEGDWLFITMRKITSGADGSSFHCHPTVLWDGE